MIVGLVFVVSAAFIVFVALNDISFLWALPAIGVVVAVLIGYAMRRGSGSGPP